MFSFYHITWLVISLVGCIVATRLLDRAKPPLEQVLTWACIIATISELMKIFSNIQMLPSADGSSMHLFMEWRHLPFHLCSIQILFIFYVRFAESEKRRETVLAFMYPTCIAGAVMALALPTIFSNSIRPEQAFTHAIAYQFFLYHSMLVVLGIYIARSGQTPIRFSHLKTTLGMLLALGMASIYVNSAF